MTIPNISDSKVYEIGKALLLTNKIDRKYAFRFLEVEGKKKKYTFRDFFLDVETVLLNTTPRPGIADAIHATIMKNNGIAEIVTFNSADFVNIDDISPSAPEDIS